MRVRLLLIRHGQTADNAAQRFTGWTDSPLSPTGLRQAEQLGSFLARTESIDALYASSLQRAVQTARLIGRGIGPEPIYRDGLRELHLGDCEGLTREEIDERFPGLLERGRDLHDLAFCWPSGESRGAFYARVRRAFAEIVSSHAGETVAVVAHSAVLSTYLAEVIDGQPWHWPKYPTNNCSVSEVVVTGERMLLVRHNDCSFLLDD